MVWVVGIGILAFLLLVFPRQVGGVVLLLIIAGAAIWTYLHFEQRSAERERSRISIAVTANTGCEDPEYPLSVSISNGTRKTIEHLTFDLVAIRPGHSGKFYDRLLSSDRIIPANHTYRACWKLDRSAVRGGGAEKLDVKPLEWTATTSSVRFAE